MVVRGRMEWERWALVLCVGSLVQGLPDEPERTYDKLFKWGVTSYTEERWLVTSQTYKRRK